MNRPRYDLEFGGNSHVDVEVGKKNEKVSMKGAGSLVGERCEKSTCKLGLELDLEQTDPLKLQAGLPIIGKTWKFTDGSAVGGSRTDLMTMREVSSNTFRGTLGKEEILAALTVEANGNDLELLEKNKSRISVKVDFNQGTIKVKDGFTLPKTKNRPKATISMDLEGEVVNQPPRAEAGPDAKLECRTPQGTEIELDPGGSEDPDPNEPFALGWQRFSLLPDETVEREKLPERTSFNSKISTIAPRGENTYLLSVFDSHFQRDSDSRQVTVVDTKPPRIKDFSFEGPPCLWPPNHKYTVLRTDRDFQAILRDACDADPELFIDKAASSQPVNSTGDGNTAPDVVVFPDHVCLRNEQQGTEMKPRTYQVGLVARDDAGNTSDPTVEIRVGHDQRPPRRCDIFESTEIVDEDSSVCDPKRAKKAWRQFRRSTSNGTTETARAPDAGTAPDTSGGSKSGTGAGGCSSAVGSLPPTHSPIWWVFGAAFGIGAFRRRRKCRRTA